MTRIVLIIAAGAALTGCGSTPSELPPTPSITVYQCATPAGLTERESQPLPPVGDYSQEDVALFITDLHQWGARGWLRVARIREHADKCAQSAEDDDND